MASQLCPDDCPCSERLVGTDDLMWNSQLQPRKKNSQLRYAPMTLRGTPNYAMAPFVIVRLICISSRPQRAPPCRW